MNKRMIMVLAVVLAAGHARADVRLPGFINSGMVLQRDTKISLWGWATPGEAVRVTFRDKTLEAKTGRDGRWFVSLGPYPAGGPYDLTLAGKNRVTLHDVLISDVWLASGQSNMELPLQGDPESSLAVNNSDHEIATARFPQIRLLIVQQEQAPKPEADIRVKENWHAVTPESVGSFSAVAYLFARELHQRYHIPIGVIESANGGTVIQAWMSTPALNRLPEFHTTISLMERVTDKIRADYDRVVRERESWYQQHGLDDRGKVAEVARWADPEMDVRSWPTIPLPRPISACLSGLNGFGGVVWFRRTITLPAQPAAHDLVLRLGRVIQDDVTYVNGVKVGETHGSQRPREYWASRQIVRPGKNTIAIRIVGSHGPDGACAGMHFEDPLTAEWGRLKIALNGPWSYQPGPDLDAFPRADEATQAAAPPSPDGPAMLFNAMIHPLLTFRIKGVIWYQGEANALDGAVQYRTFFPALIRDWREQWGYDFPFLYVQLAGFGPNTAEPADYPWAELREAQDMALSLPATGMATAVDIGDENNIHPKNKLDVAYRLALAAEKIAYGENVVDSGPRYQSMQIEEDRARIKFSEIGSGLFVEDNYGYGRGFEIAGADRQFHWAQAHQDGQDILVSSEAVPNPIAVRYDWSNTPDGNVYNQEGLPAVPFRTDGPKHR